MDKAHHRNGFDVGVMLCRLPDPAIHADGWPGCFFWYVLDSIELSVHQDHNTAFLRDCIKDRTEIVLEITFADKTDKIVAALKRINRFEGLGVRIERCPLVSWHRCSRVVGGKAGGVKGNEYAGRAMTIKIDPMV